MISNDKALVAMRIAELNDVAKAQRLARDLRRSTEPMPRWSIVRLVRPGRPIEAA